MGFHVGYGHFFRCLGIIQALPRDQKIGICINDEGISSLSGLLQHVECAVLTRKESFITDVVVIDLSYGPYLVNPDILKAQVSKWSKNSQFVCLVDGLMEYALVKDREWPLDVVIIPYVGGEAPITGDFQESPKWFCGCQYAVLPKEYKGVPRPRIISKKVAHVLVTHGGTDPYYLTEKSIVALSKLNQFTEIRIIIGPGFDAQRRQKLEMLGARNSAINFVSDRQKLMDDYLWCDMAIAATGNTKYELAATGTPSVQISMTEQLDRVNKPFSSEKTCVDAGVLGVLDTVELTQMIIQLADNLEVRTRQSINGQNLIDCCGLERIVGLLEINSKKRK